MRRHTGPWGRVLAAALAFCLLFPTQAIAKTIEEVQAQQEQLEKERQDLEQQLEALRADEEKALEYQEALAQKISLTEQKIDTSRESIQVMDQEIRALEKKLELSRQEYEDTIQLFSQRVKALYVSGSAGTLEILLSADSFTDFSLKTEMLTAMARHDQELVDRIQEYLEKTQQDRQALQGMREQEAQVKRDLEAAQQELEGLYEENDALIADLEARQLIAQDTIAQKEQEDAALEEELQKLIEQKNEEERRRKQQAQMGVAPPAGSSDGSVSMRGDFAPIWPLPGIGFGNITGNYGDMYFNGPHNGMDIGAGYGTPIVAAQAGQVLSAEYHWSWGNNVLIWHNDTFSTRYAHCSSLAVSAGQYVEAGQTIGYVGSTGESFGNHLHFEVYQNGTRTDPRYFLAGF